MLNLLNLTLMLLSLSACLKNTIPSSTLEVSSSTQNSSLSKTTVATLEISAFFPKGETALCENVAYLKSDCLDSLASLIQVSPRINTFKIILNSDNNTYPNLKYHYTLKDTDGNIIIQKENLPVSNQEINISIDDQSSSPQSERLLSVTVSDPSITLKHQWYYTVGTASQLPRCLQNPLNPSARALLNGRSIFNYWGSTEYTNHGIVSDPNVNPLLKGEYPLDQTYSFNGQTLSTLMTNIQSNVDGDFNIQSAIKSQRLIDSFEILCAADYVADAGGVPKDINWYDTVESRMKYLQKASSSDCQGGTLAFVNSDNAHTMYLCDSIATSKNVLDISVTILHESRHGNQQGWLIHDFFMTPMTALTTLKSALGYDSSGQPITGKTYFDEFFAPYAMDSSDYNYFTNDKRMPGYPHTPCQGNINSQSSYAYKFACDPLFVPYTATEAERNAEGGGAYSYDVYFLSRISQGGLNFTKNARAWSCLEGYLLYATRFVRYQESSVWQDAIDKVDITTVAARDLQTKPSNKQIAELFGNCVF